MSFAKHSAMPPEDIEAAAAYWLARSRLGLMTAREREQFAAWRTDPACADAYAAAEATFEDLGSVAADPRMRQMRDAALASGPVRSSSSRVRYGYAATAAVIALVALFAIRSGFDRPSTEPVATAPATASTVDVVTAATKRYSTKVGERSAVTLEDGSVVSLNTASMIEVAYSAERRDVRLLQGQALFQVAKNHDRPFVVSAGDRRVTAVGTAFDVRVDPGSVKVVLVEGRVTVEPMQRSGLDRLIPALARMELAPGEQLTAAANHPVSIAVADVERDTSWRRGEIIFRDDTLAIAVAEMNRYTQTQILVDDPRVAQLRVSGVFGVARPENFVAALTAYYPIDAQERSGNVTVLTWRDSDSTHATPIR
jgi:transmembrane sensor